jgi:hypothetical protein
MLDKNINYFWYLSFLIAFTRLFFYDSALFYNSQLIDEIGTLYLQDALSKGFWGNFLSKEAGYFVFFQRFLSYIVVKTTPLYYFPYILNIIALVIASFCLSFICSQDNRLLIKSDILRFIFSITMIIFPASTNLFLGMIGYFTIIVMFLLIFQNKENFSTLKYIFYLVFVIIFCIGKIHILVLIPFIFVALLYHIKHKQINSALFWVLPLILMVGNALSVLITILKGRQVFANITTNLIKNSDLHSIVNIYLIFPLKSYFGLLTTINNYDDLNILMGFLIILLVLYDVYKNKSKSNLKSINVFIISVLLFTFLSVFLAYFGLWTIPNSPQTTNTRGILIAFIILSIGMLSYIDNLILSNFKKIVFVCFLCLIILVKTYFYQNKFNYQIGDWKQTYVLLLNDDYFLPKYIGGWGTLEKQNIMLYSQEGSNGKFKNLSEVFDGLQKIRAIVVETNDSKHIYLIAYNKQNKVIGKATLYSNLNKKYKLLNFDGERVSPAYIKIFDNESKEIKADIVMVGGLPN